MAETAISSMTQAPIASTQKLRIAIAGNPNCGKTTLFNALTGLRHKVANYPGVTVEKKEGSMQLPELGEVAVIDLPGIYTLFGSSIDEVIASQALFGELKTEAVPNLIVSVIDASNLERNLYLTSQLLDLGVPILLALNMQDLAEKRGISIKTEILSRLLDVPVVAIVARKGTGVEALKAEMLRLLKSPSTSSKAFSWCPSPEYLEAALALSNKLENASAESPPSTLQQRSSKILKGLALLSESHSSVEQKHYPEIEKTRAELISKDIEPFSIEATQRYHWINEIVKKSSVVTELNRGSLSEKLDKLATHRVWGLLIFVLIMGVIFQSIFMWASIPMDYIDKSFSSFGAWVGTHLAPGQLRSLLVDGVIAGVGSVLIFVPQISILFFFLGLLEDSGYLSRAAFLMDRVMRPVGLQGRSFIPLLSSFACAIPGVMATRTIPSFSDRMTTILVAPLMSCSARLPVYTLLISAFIPQHYVFGFLSLQGLVLLAMYLLGIIGAAVIAFILRLSIFRGDPAIFVMEMPSFRFPQIKVVLRDVFDRVIIFLKNAGTIILACSIILWFLASNPRDPSGELVVEHSYAGRVGKFLEPVIKPLGYNWEIGVGLVASFAAREVFVTSLATVYNLQDGDDAAESLVGVLKDRKAKGTFSVATALSLMVFYVFACQCISTLAVCRRETGSWKWPILMFCYMTVLAYASAFTTYHVALRVL